MKAFLRLLLVLVLPLTLIPTDSMADDPSPTGEHQHTEQPSPAPYPAVDTAWQDWRAAWDKTPRLVQLKDDTTGDQDTTQAIETRLKRLGEKTFSNREWKKYWEEQQKTAADLQQALATVSGPGAATAGQMARGLELWAALASEKIDNQDRYFRGIEAERDALDERLEGLMEAPVATVKPAFTSTEIPNPYERRKLHLAELKQRIELQKQKRQLAEFEGRFIENQLESESLLMQSLTTDVELARRELAIAKTQASLTSEGVWVGVWSQIATQANNKVRKLQDDALDGNTRQRKRKVEAGLATSQLEFRAQRIAELEQQHEDDSSYGSLMQAGWETFVLWGTEQAWRIAIYLSFLLIGIRLALRLVAKVSALIMGHAEGEPDNDDDVDQRSKTLASVFSGMARIAIYIIGGLWALSVIGVNTGPILGSVAILGLAVSFGSQNLVRDLVNGFFILLENQYAVGEVVSINGKSGSVEQITIRSTWIRQANGDLHVMPNGEVKVVSNFTRDWSKALCHIGVAYDADLGQVEAIVNATGEAMYKEEEWQDALEEAPHWVGVTELGDSSVVIRIQAKVTPGNQWGITRELNRRMKIAFDEAGIEIPFPQRVIHSQSA